MPGRVATWAVGLGVATFVGGAFATAFGQVARPALERSPLSALATEAPVPGPSLSRSEGRASLARWSPAQTRATLRRYCLTCHNGRLRTAGLALDALDAERVAEHPAAWEMVVAKLRAGAMPPAGRPRPDRATYAALAASLEAALDRAAAADPNPGRKAAHRLNRREYVNAVRDLLGLEVDAAALLPPDDVDRGFDNMADALAMSPALLDRYIFAARRIARLAVGDPAVGPSTETYSLPNMRFQDQRMSEELPFGSRGGLAVRHDFPVDGEYEVRIRLRRQLYDYVRGLQNRQRLEVRLDGARVTTFDVGGAPGTPPPRTFAGAVAGDSAWEEYTLHADERLALRVPVRAGSRTVGVSFVQGRTERDGVLQPRATGKVLAIAERWSSPSEAPEAAVEDVSVSGPFHAAGAGETPARRRLFVCHPTAVAEETPCAREVLGRVARRAFRRPLAGADLDTLLAFYEAGRTGGGFDAGIRRGLESILVDPEFLFRFERDPVGSPGRVGPAGPAGPPGPVDAVGRVGPPRPGDPAGRAVAAPAADRTAPAAGAEPAGAVHPISDLELASRLSFFLWSSIPDDELLDLAAEGRLRNPEVLEAQVRRMLADPRAEALVDGFATQWLALRTLPAVVPTPELFPEFDDNLRQAFARETGLFVGSQIREDRSLLDLLRADYTFVNERLARHYGIPDVYGSRFRRVNLEDDSRGGLLGHGSILTVTSYPTRTSPVLRGHWLLEHMLGAPPPPPPPDVPALPDRGAGGRAASVRERLERHRENAVCANCHAPMDPLGFALDHFDAIGRWRAAGEAGDPIDASGVLPDGTALRGLSGLRDALLDRRAQFVRTVAEKLTTYALGRGLEHYDMPAVRRIVRDAADDDYRWSALVLGIVRSLPFQMRRSES